VVLNVAVLSLDWRLTVPGRRKEILSDVFGRKQQFLFVVQVQQHGQSLHWHKPITDDLFEPAVADDGAAYLHQDVILVVSGPSDQAAIVGALLLALCDIEMKQIAAMSDDQVRTILVGAPQLPLVGHFLRPSRQQLLRLLLVACITLHHYCINTFFLNKDKDMSSLTPHHCWKALPSRPLLHLSHKDTIRQ